MTSGEEVPHTAFGAAADCPFDRASSASGTLDGRASPPRRTASAAAGALEAAGSLRAALEHAHTAPTQVPLAQVALSRRASKGSLQLWRTSTAVCGQRRWARCTRW